METPAEPAVPCPIGSEPVPDGAELVDQAPELLAVEGGHGGEVPRPPGCELDPHDPVVSGIGAAADEATLLGAVYQLHGAVVAEQEVVCDLADGGRRAVAADGQQELVLGRREA